MFNIELKDPSKVHDVENPGKLAKLLAHWEEDVVETGMMGDELVVWGLRLFWLMSLMIRNGFIMAKQLEKVDQLNGYIRKTLRT